ncbi:YusW family protein [Sporosarcina sp. ACRSM]|uniref:YusW family protein n=1 Tax=Sporosarcina sp. ACRSM TaxID=2918216 RepID=UPI001EF52E20|nr:YusW family protein [Sporosarcina sp. ACRSM]MCG7335035.1 YusW family protein [Sporosarcina sp. ACRSM]
MKFFKLTTTVTLTGALLLSGCGNFGKNADEPNREDADIIHEHEKEGGSLETGDGYGFSTFDLEIDVDGKDAIDVDYDVTERADADYDNKLKNIKLQGNEAMDQLNKLFLDILITKDTPKQEVIDKILDWYQLDAYSKFDLEVNFDDGTKLNIEDVQ